MSLIRDRMRFIEALGAMQATSTCVTAMIYTIYTQALRLR